jgi:hypothetical protein
MKFSHSFLAASISSCECSSLSAIHENIVWGFKTNSLLVKPKIKYKKTSLVKKTKQKLGPKRKLTRVNGNEFITETKRTGYSHIVYIYKEKKRYLALKSRRVSSPFVC